MANEAFALSPISARAASPSDADFDAIREAFVETARGRWFLDEYTKRNRNADTAMVLEAVARIEQSLAAQKEDQQRQALSEQASAERPSDEQPSNALPEAMAAVRAIVSAARESVASMLAGPAFEESLAPSRKCARVIREIAWGLRESGADSRICSLLESQVDAINAACDHAMAGGLRDNVLQAFDQAVQQIDGIGAETSHPVEPVAAIRLVDLDPTPVESIDESQDIAIDDNLFELVATPEASAPDTMIEAVAAAEEDLLVEESLSTEAMASIEMDSAPELRRTVHLEIVPDTKVEPAAALEQQHAATAPLPTLGESLIASGIVARSAPSRSDPLASIRRMSQAEKIAFFS